MYGNDPPFLKPITEEDDLSSIVKGAIQDALQYVEQELGPERAKANAEHRAKAGYVALYPQLAKK